VKALRSQQAELSRAARVLRFALPVGAAGAAFGFFLSPTPRARGVWLIALVFLLVAWALSWLAGRGSQLSSSNEDPGNFSSGIGGGP
jgi:hypothetical protein